MHDRDLSFFHLTTSHPDTGESNLIHELTPDEFDMCHAEAEPLVDAPLAAIQTYSEAHTELSMMAVYMACDVGR